MKFLIRVGYYLLFLYNSILMGAGYYNPNSSIDASALCSANIANVHKADASYYNPANMVYSSKNLHEIEVSLTYISLNPIYYDSNDNIYHIHSKPYTTFVPSFHYVSSQLTSQGLRVGFSIVSPAGLSREWNEFPATVTAKKYQLQTLEFNPTIAIPVTPHISFGFGLRYMKARGKAALDGSMLGANAFTLSVNGDANAFGYNVALSYNNGSWKIATTYRSQIDLDLQGSADAVLGTTPFVSNVSLLTPVPANFIIAVAYSFDNVITLEGVYHQTMWSAVKETNFEFDNPIVEAFLGQPQKKLWHDVESYRVGLTVETDDITYMTGFAYGLNAADDAYVTFSSPESDAYAFSLGGRYHFSDKVDFGIAGLYTKHKKRTVIQSSPLGVQGTFSNKGAFTVTFGSNIKF